MKEATVLFERPRGDEHPSWFVIGPPFAHESGDRVKVRDDIVLVVANFDVLYSPETIEEVPGLRKVDAGGGKMLTDGFRRGYRLDWLEAQVEAGEPVPVHPAQA